MKQAFISTFDMKNEQVNVTKNIAAETMASVNVLQSKEEQTKLHRLIQKLNLKDGQKTS